MSNRSWGWPESWAGIAAAITAATRDIALESAWFVPSAIAGRARRYGLQTDASQRFERGVDWKLQERALELATRLIVQLAGGRAAPVSIAEQAEALPQHVIGAFACAARLERLLGSAVPAGEIEQRLRALGMSCARTRPPMPPRLRRRSGASNRPRGAMTSA